MSVARLLAQHNIKPKKSLGQNFLEDANALARVADAADVGPGDAVLEIGAGLGHLTSVLAERVGSKGRVVAVEIDGRLMSLLEMRVAPFPQVDVVLGDMLQLEPSDLLDGLPYKVAANVPYYITSALMRYLLECDHPPTLLALTVQREVAARITAMPGKMSVLAVSVQLYGTPRTVGQLKAGAFYPRPAVASAIVRIEPHVEPALPTEQREVFFRIVRAGFGQKRKQLKNSLQAGLELGSEEITRLLAGADIDGRRRAETLSIAEWRRLHAAFGGGQMTDGGEAGM